MNKKQLSSEQKNAVEIISKAIDNKEIVSLQGPGGTGKTFVIESILKDISVPYILCAPTHKAALVMGQATKDTAITLHSLLALSPNLDIFELDFNNLLFKADENKLKFPKNGVVICDEASMINDDLFKALESRCKEFNDSLVLILDEKQLAPVKSEKLSLSCNVKNTVKLTKIFRQSSKNGILKTLETLRDTSINKFDNCPGEEGSLIVEPDINNFLKNYISHVKLATETNNILETKLLAYTNKRVNLYNNIVKKVLFNDEFNYHKNEILTGCENFTYDKFDFWNGMDYIVKDVCPNNIKLPYSKIIITGFDLLLYDAYTKSEVEVFIADKSNKFLEIGIELEKIRLKAINNKRDRIKSAKYWGMYYTMVNSFASPVNITFDDRIVKKQTFAGGYAISIHKSQGSSINNVFIDMQDVNRCFDSATKRQLQYVAVSRTRNNVYIYQ